MMDGKIIYDTTLRDGEQMPGVVFSEEDKIMLAKKISYFGVNIIDVMPSVSPKERKTIEHLVDLNLDAEISASTMMKEEHVNIAVDCGVSRICMFSPVSEIQMNGMRKKKNLERAIYYVDYARSHGLKVDFAAVDATRADRKYLVDFANALKNKVDYFFACDSLGILTPMQTKNFIESLKEETDIRIGLHCHNDFGQAVANSLVGLEAGADVVSGTFLGIGERAGNAALEEVVMSLKEQYDAKLPLRYEILSEICRDVSHYSGVNMQKHKAIIGENAFVHESGVHVDAMLKNPKSYENFDPASIGATREYVAGKHSGKSILKYWFGQFFDDACYEAVLTKIKDLSQKQKKVLSKKDVLKIFSMEHMQ